MSINSYIAKQFAAPRGIGGALISMVMNRQNRPLYDETIHLLELCDSDSVLDIGCGNGYVLGLLAQKHRAACSGIDTSATIIHAAARRMRKYKNTDFSCQSVSAMSFADESFSKAYTINTVYFWPKLEGPMAEIRRVLKNKGIFINTLYSNETLSRFSHTQYGYRRYEENELLRAGTEAGFKVEVFPVLAGAAKCYVYKKM